jgi:RNA polymerase sigma factor (sigma-70 family)
MSYQKGDETADHLIFGEAAGNIPTQPEPHSSIAVFFHSLAEGNHKALLEFRNRYLPLIRRICAEKLRPADADEVASDALARALSKADHFDPALGTPENWLARLTRNLCTDRLRTLRAEEPCLSLDEDAPQEGGSLAEQLPDPSRPCPLGTLLAACGPAETNDPKHPLLTIVLEKLRLLSPRDQELIWGREAGKSFAELAKDLGMGIGAARTAHSRSVARLVAGCRDAGKGFSNHAPQASSIPCASVSL